jgi:hypothetical protein
MHRTVLQWEQMTATVFFNCSLVYPPVDCGKKNILSQIIMSQNKTQFEAFVSTFNKHLWLPSIDAIGHYASVFSKCLVDDLWYGLDMDVAIGFPLNNVTTFNKVDVPALIDYITKRGQK